MSRASRHSISIRLSFFALSKQLWWGTQMDPDIVCPVLLPSGGIAHVFKYLEDGNKKHFSFFFFFSLQIPFFLCHAYYEIQLCLSTEKKKIIFFWGLCYSVQFCLLTAAGLRIRFHQAPQVREDGLVFAPRDLHYSPTPVILSSGGWESGGHFSWDGNKAFAWLESPSVGLILMDYRLMTWEKMCLFCTHD